MQVRGDQSLAWLRIAGVESSVSFHCPCAKASMRSSTRATAWLHRAVDSAHRRRHRRRHGNARADRALHTRAVGERRRPARVAHRPQQVGVEDQFDGPCPVAHRPQPTVSCSDGGLCTREGLLLTGQPLRGSRIAHAVV